jgi:hypothetical protein
MLPKFETDLVASSNWPGFNERGVLVLPLSGLPARALPEACEIDGVTLLRKSEFHLTLLSRTEANSVRVRLADAEIESLFSAQEWTCRASGPCWLLRKFCDDSRVANSVVVLCAAPALNEFRAAVAGRCDVALPPVPAHVTLFVAGRERGIGLSSYEDFHAFRVRLVADFELDRGMVRG